MNRLDKIQDRCERANALVETPLLNEVRRLYDPMRPADLADLDKTGRTDFSEDHWFELNAVAFSVICTIIDEHSSEPILLQKQEWNGGRPLASTNRRLVVSMCTCMLDGLGYRLAAPSNEYARRPSTAVDFCERYLVLVAERGEQVVHSWTDPFPINRKRALASFRDLRSFDRRGIIKMVREQRKLVPEIKTKMGSH